MVPLVTPGCLGDRVPGLDSFDGALFNGATAVMPFINSFYFSGEEV